MPLLSVFVYCSVADVKISKSMGKREGKETWNNIGGLDLEMTMSQLNFSKTLNYLHLVREKSYASR